MGLQDAGAAMEEQSGRLRRLDGDFHFQTCQVGHKQRTTSTDGAQVRLWTATERPQLKLWAVLDG
ncbi:hypothetical protein P3T76_004003 [Phytophthora citrophthora]|uniref:Uncharacterized protein n=1 Tax=Phytophthora citrophthora TaxID=4793 RepID=A0AAD9LPW4_9STRA|nr:hypothetical protein P3T76_004003 [Phytophthora citrophthora]